MKIIIYVCGGVVSEVRADDVDVSVEVFDVDNMKADLYTGKMIDVEWEKKTKEFPHVVG